MLAWTLPSGLRANKRAIGVDITPHATRALQITKQHDQWLIEKVFSAPTQRHSDTPTSILQQLTEHGFDRHADVAVAMPYNTVFYREVVVETPPPIPYQQPGTSQSDNDFPIPPDQLLTQPCNERDLPEGGASRLVAATDRDSIQERLDRLSHLQIAPKLMESEIFAVRTSALVNHPEIRSGLHVIAYVDQCHLSLAILEDSRVLVVRNTPIVLRTKRLADISLEQKEAELISHEVRMTWEKLFQEKIDYNTQVLIATEHTFSQGLVAYVEGELRCPTRLLDPCNQIQCLADLNVGHDMVIAEGLAMRMFAPDQMNGINFLEDLQTKQGAPVNLPREASICSALLLAIAVVWVIGLAMERSSLESKYSGIKADIEHSFRLAAPQDRHVVNPVVQLTQKIEALEQHQQLFNPYSSGSSPLTVMQRISMSRPQPSYIQVNDLLIADESVRIQATCASFDEAYRWQRALEETPGFTEVEVRDPQKDNTTGNVQFKVILTLGKA